MMHTERICTIELLLSVFIAGCSTVSPYSAQPALTSTANVRDITCVTNDQVQESRPIVSPDGKRISFNTRSLENRCGI